MPPRDRHWSNCTKPMAPNSSHIFTWNEERRQIWARNPIWTTVTGTISFIFWPGSITVIKIVYPLDGHWSVTHSSECYYKLHWCTGCFDLRRRWPSVQFCTLHQMCFCHTSPRSIMVGNMDYPLDGCWVKKTWLSAGWSQRHWWVTDPLLSMCCRVVLQAQVLFWLIGA